MIPRAGRRRRRHSDDEYHHAARSWPAKRLPTMSVQLDHAIVPARDRKAAAELLANLLGVPWAESAVGPFCPVYVNEGLTLDFDQADGPFPVQHYCFRVSEAEFDAILARIRARGIEYRSTPHGPVDMQINTRHGGRIVYWNEPDGHVWEALTVSYARQPRTGTQVEARAVGSLKRDPGAAPAGSCDYPRAGEHSRPGRSRGRESVQALTAEQVADWRRNGFLAPFPLLSGAERQHCLDGLDRFESWLGEPVNGAAELKWRTMPYLLMPWAARLARDPRILDRVEALLGPDILIYTGTFFIKEPDSPTIAAWHQDSTYYGLSPADEVTVWIALTRADEAAGCMETLPFDGSPRQMRHRTRIVENSVNRASQRIVEPLDDARAVPMPLRPGEFSMHHGLTPHRSGPNRSNHRRVGLGLNYIPTSVRPIGSAQAAAMLVRGADHYGHFELQAPPIEELDAAAVAAHDRAVSLYRANYVVEEARHAKWANAT